MIARQPGLTGKQAKKGTQEHQAAKMEKKVKNFAPLRLCVKISLFSRFLLVGFGIN